MLCLVFHHTQLNSKSTSITCLETKSKLWEVLWDLSRMLKKCLSSVIIITSIVTLNPIPLTSSIRHSIEQKKKDLFLELSSMSLIGQNKMVLTNDLPINL